MVPKIGKPPECEPRRAGVDETTCVTLQGKTLTTLSSASSSVSVLSSPPERTFSSLPSDWWSLGRLVEIFGEYKVFSLMLSYSNGNRNNKHSMVGGGIGKEVKE